MVVGGAAPRPQVLEEPEPCEPEKVGPEEMEPPGPEEPEPREPEKVRLEKTEPPGPEQPSELEIAAGALRPSVAAGAASDAGKKEASSGDSAAVEASPAALAEGSPGGAEQRSGEAAGEAPEERDVAEESDEERRERAALLEELHGLAGERQRQVSARLQVGELRRLRPALAEDEPQPYAQRLLQLQQQREQRDQAAAAYREQVAARRRCGEERQARAQAEWAAFQARKKAVAVCSLGRRLCGGEEVVKAVDRIQARERDKEQQIRKASVENAKQKHEIQSLETSLKAQGELAEGQRVTEWEQMKKENQEQSRKIDSLSEESLRLKKKIVNAVHILSQFREKLQFVEAENEGRKAELMDINSALSQKRDVLTKTKQARDRLWRNNLKLQQKCGLLGNEILLRDFEEKVDTVELLSQQLERLKRHHASLMLTQKKKNKEASSLFLAEDDCRTK